MILKIISIILYIVSGYFITMMGVISFVNFDAVDKPDTGTSPLFIKLLILGIFCIPPIILLIISAAINRFQKWKKPIGITLLTGVSVTIFMVISMASFL